jgi:hypothetical protein
VINCYNNPNWVYIGKTKNSRENDHKKIYGNQIEYFYIDEIKSLEHKDWEPLETFWIEYFKFLGFKLMNKRKKGGSGPDFHTFETRIKMSKPKPNSGGKNKPKPGTSKSLKGKPRPDVRERFKGKPLNQEHVSNLKLGHLKKDKTFYKSDIWLKNIKKPILQYDLKGNFIKEWFSIREASIFLKINESSISQQLGGKQKTSGGYIWKFKN